jgi:hypothetical protein
MRSLAVISLLVLAACPDKASQQDKIDVVDIQVKKLALEIYPRWAMSNPAKQCPASLAELAASMSSEHDFTKDIWDRPLKMLCGSSAPPEAKGFAVISFGPDGTEGTDDDIKSWVRK